MHLAFRVSCCFFVGVSLVLCFPLRTSAQETVVRADWVAVELLRESPGDPYGSSGYATGNLRPCKLTLERRRPRPIKCQPPAGEHTFQVYTVPQIDLRLRQVDANLADSARVLHGQIQALDTRLKREVQQSIEGLPDRLMAEAVKKAVVAAVLEELRPELQRLRTDLHSRLEALADAVEKLQEVRPP